MVPKWSWTPFRWIFPDGQQMVERCSENGPRGTAYITQWLQNARKMVPGRPQTIIGTLFHHFRTIFLQIENPKGAAAEGRPLYLKENCPEMVEKCSQNCLMSPWHHFPNTFLPLRNVGGSPVTIFGPFFNHFWPIGKILQKVFQDYLLDICVLHNVADLRNTTLSLPR